MKAKSLALPLTYLTLIIVPILQHRTIASLRHQQNKKVLSLESNRSTERTNSRPLQPTHLSSHTALRLAAIVDSLERNIALTEWVAQFTTSEEITTVIRALNEDPAYTPKLGNRIAEYLTRKWAKIAPETCIDAFLQAAAVNNNGPFRHTPRLLFYGIQLKNPQTFKKYFGTIPPDFFSALKGDSNSATFKKWTSHPVLPLSEKRKPNGSLVHEILNTLALYAPDHILDMARLNPQDSEIEFWLKQNSFYKALKKNHRSANDLWAATQDLPPSSERDALLQRISENALVDEPRPIADILSEIANLSAGPRQLSELKAIGNHLEAKYDEIKDTDPGEQNQWLDDVIQFGDIMNDLSSTDDSSYDNSRAQMARLSATLDFEKAIQWTQSIIDPETRMGAVTSLAAKQDAKGNYDPSLISIKKNGNSQSSWLLYATQKFATRNTSSTIRTSLTVVELPSGLSIPKAIEIIENALKKENPASVLKNMEPPTTN